MGSVGRYRWRTTLEGIVVITEPPAFVDERAPVLGEAGAKLITKIEADWGPICREIGHDYGIPDGWLLAMIYRVSGGDPRKRNPEPNGWVGVGLLQITHPSLKAGRMDSEVALPAINIKIGASFIHGLIQRYGKDFPKVAAAFNAGGVYESARNPWGMLSTGDHISVEVAALNTWHKQRIASVGSTVARTFIDLTELAREYDELARKDTEPPPDSAA